MMIMNQSLLILLAGLLSNIVGTCLAYGRRAGSGHRSVPTRKPASYSRSKSQPASAKVSYNNKNRQGSGGPKRGAYTYSLNLENGKKYVGSTTNIQARLNQHFSGAGSRVTQQMKPISINHIQKCRSVTNAKKAETIVYNNMKNYHGKDNVRGAGHTKRF